MGGVQKTTVATTKLDQATLDFLLENFHKSVPTGRWIEPYTIPTEWDDESGTLEAMEEIFAAKERISHKKGFINNVESLGLSEKALDILNRWNRLNLSIYYTHDEIGNGELTIAGIGNSARAQLCRFSGIMRGLAMLIVALRQCADFCETPDGEEIVSVVDPLTGGRLQFTGFNPVEKKRKPLVSQDHWEKPVNVYGHLAEVDLIRNSRFIAGKHSPEGFRTITNSAKSDKTPLRAVYTLLVDNKLLEKEKGPKGSRYHPSKPELSFLPPGVTQEWEQTGEPFQVRSQWAVEFATSQIRRELLELSGKEKVKEKDIFNYLWVIVRHMRERNYSFFHEAKENLPTKIERSLIPEEVFEAVPGGVKKGTFWKPKQTEKFRAEGHDPQTVREQILASRESLLSLQPDFIHYNEPFKL